MSDFCPALWPEELVPNNVKDCCKCGLDKHGTRMVWGEGNPDSPIMIILDNPGAREDREGNSFICGTRQTLQQAANEVGLKMEDLYVTFILKRKPVRAYDKDQTRQICIQYLEQQTQVINSVFILCSSSVTVHSFF